MLNRVVLIGRLTRDRELRYTPGGVAVTSFNLAVNRRFTNQQGEREADFIDIVAWRQLAETVANYMKKGRLVAVEGRLQIRSYKIKKAVGSRWRKWSPIMSSFWSRGLKPAQVPDTTRIMETMAVLIRTKATGAPPPTPLRTTGNRSIFPMMICPFDPIVGPNESLRKGGLSMARRRGNKRRKVCYFTVNKIRIYRLQRCGPAPEVCQRTGQNPASPGDGDIFQISAAVDPGNQTCPANGFVAVHHGLMRPKKGRVCSFFFLGISVSLGKRRKMTGNC